MRWKVTVFVPQRCPGRLRGGEVRQIKGGGWNEAWEIHVNHRERSPVMLAEWSTGLRLVMLEKSWL